MIENNLSCYKPSVSGRLVTALVTLLMMMPVMGRGAVILTDSLGGSVTYPGTVHHFKVSVPEGYDEKAGACLYLGLDGILCDAPAVIDSLIAEGAMPMTVGVYLQPGIVKDASGRVLRYNRSNEFDATDTMFVHFLATELLPAVESMSLPDGRKIRLRQGGAERMIFGLSSGGIAAFTAAWHRPDLFGRVFSGCGTFVPMRGGNDLQAIVRKTEPKPLRICLQDGYQDTWNPLFGSWFEANAMLGTALEFAGYDCWFDWAEGGHSVRRAAEIFEGVMRKMWHDYPAPLEPGKTGNDFLAPLLENAGEWQRVEGAVTEQAGDSAGRYVNLPGGMRAALYPDGKLCAASRPGSNYMDQYLADGRGGWSAGQRFYWLHAYDNSIVPVWDMTFDGKGMLWVLTGAGIQICDQNGRVRGILDLPAGFNPEQGTIVITPGTVTLREADGTRAFSRKLNITAPQPGMTPPSQGQG